jgi:hypothetical protein
MQQHRRRQHFKVTALIPMNCLSVAPDPRDVRQIVRSVLIVREVIQKIRRKLIERMEQR